MRKLFSILACFAFLACANQPFQIASPVNPTLPSPECNAALDAITAGKAGPSIIRERIPNPCDAYRLAVTAAKLGVIWDAYSLNQLVSWMTNVKDTVAAGITPTMFKDLIAVQIKGFNKRMAGTFLVLSDLIVVMEGNQLLSPADQALINYGLDQLLIEARRLALLGA